MQIPSVWASVWALLPLCDGPSSALCVGVVISWLAFGMLGGMAWTRRDGRMRTRTFGAGDGLHVSELTVGMLQRSFLVNTRTSQL